ncbi:hypothetical protein [Pseudomonas sp. Hp2]|uniref:hypothetical protein n=1 Tax=Pseudomonas sp. Hp2 TaxID=701189 RepID=UPI001125EE5A|nr:hypothetical protein [Pseudomonas sp. Hp2]
MTKYLNHLSIKHRGKPIPYGGDGVLRDDGDANYGFRYVKGDEAALRAIPELTRDPALLDLVLAVNAKETGLFSVGCVSGPVDDERGHRDSGYIEFAINSKSAISDATSYFPLFFHFDRFLYEAKFSAPVSFNWELEGATFLECGSASGFTCAIIINTDYSATREEATHIWSESLGALAYFLQSVPPERADFLYLQ